MKMADSRFVEITLDDMDAFLKRAFRALRPRRSQGRRGEITYDLSLSDDYSILIKVYTSIYTGSGLGRGKGADSIKVVMLTDKGKPLMPAAKIVMRTRNWRTALQERIEDYFETYEAKAQYWKDRRLERNDGTSRREDALDVAVRESLPPPSPTELRETESEEPEESVEVEPVVESGPFEGGYKRLTDGSWAVQLWGEPRREGDEGVAVTKGQKRTKVRLVERVQSFVDKYHGNQKSEVWRFEDVNPVTRGPYRRYGADPMVASVMDRYVERCSSEEWTSE